MRSKKKLAERGEKISPLRLGIFTLLHRYDLRCKQIQLAGVRAQVQLENIVCKFVVSHSWLTYSRKTSTPQKSSKMMNHLELWKVFQPEDLGNYSFHWLYPGSKKTVAAGTTGKMKSKWVNAFKNIKGNKQEPRYVTAVPKVSTSQTILLARSHLLLSQLVPHKSWRTLISSKSTLTRRLLHVMFAHKY